MRTRPGRSTAVVVRAHPIYPSSEASPHTRAFGGCFRPAWHSRARSCARSISVKLAWLLLLSAALLSGPATRAMAQSDEAREAFRQGVRAFRQDDFERARELFERAYELSERPSILVNLGSAQRQTGQLLQARESYRRFLELSDDERLKGRVRAELEEVEALIPQLRIRVENLAPSDVVTVDGQVLVDLNAPFETNPGWREVRVTRGGRVVASVRVNVEPEGREEVSLTVPELTDPREVAQQAQRAPREPDRAALHPEDENEGSPVGLIVGVSVGVVAAAVAVVLAILLTGGNEDPYQGNVPPGSVPIR